MGVVEQKHVGGVSRANNPQRANLIDAGIAGVELDEDVVATNVSLQ